MAGSIALRVDLFDFELPEERIALYPAEPRESARLLHVDAAGGLADHLIGDLAGLLRPDDLMVLNDTKVIPAFLAGRRGEARIEVNLHQPLGQGRWRAFARPARKLRPGDRIDFAGGLSARVQAPHRMGEVELDFGCSDKELLSRLHRAGEPPLPPYIRRKRAVEAEDTARYQTLFAAEAGAVAAPTAGLHFTPELLAQLDSRGVERCTLTLHVGAGTFLPVSAEDTRGHRMHAEYGRIGEGAAARINAAKADGRRIVAVGTTVLRLLESASTGTGRLEPYDGHTDIFITPGYQFRLVDVLLTNFHLPKSTLFMLVSAFAGRETMLAAYRHAIDAGYRFYSFGDACLLERAA